MSKSNEWAEFTRLSTTKPRHCNGNSGQQKQNNNKKMSVEINSCLYRMSTVTWYILPKQTVACTMYLWAKCNHQEQEQQK